MKKKKQSLLWQIKHPAVDRPSFLFGTMHVRDQQAFLFLEQAYTCLHQCDALATEYDLSQAATPDLAITMVFQDGRKLSHFFRPKQYQKLQAILLKAFGVSIRQFEHFVPLFLINVISEQLLQKDRPQALDAQLSHYAESIGKTILGIETLEEQMAILQQIPIDYQIQLLRSLGRNVSKFRKSTLSSTDLYQSADPQKLYQMVRKSSQGLRRLLLFNRNHIMADRINEMVQKQATLCAIGAGHLSGKEGVLRLLKLKGFHVRPLL
jgi:uncharacterized protein YbaP (TraB family)